MVLIIDDEEDMRDACAQALSSLGCSVVGAADGRSGLDLLRSERPDLVLIDLKMAGIDGMSLLQQIRDEDPTVVTVMITGFATVDAAVEAMRQGAYEFLPKPFTPEHLRAVARRGLERRRLAAAAEGLRQERERVRGNLISLVSHELRSPLVAVDQYLEVLLGGMAGELLEEQRKILQQTRARVERLLSLVSDWLAVGRMADGRIAAGSGPVSLSHVVGDVCRTLEAEAEDASVTLSYKSPPGPCHVTGDAEALSHVFSNLVSNAIQYNREGGRIDVDLEQSGDRVIVRVSDTGLGIPRQNIPFIFDEFFRGDDESVRAKPGSGLGLALVRSIVTAHRGCISVQSEVGEGTTFTVSLPVGGAASGPVEAADSEASE